MGSPLSSASIYGYCFLCPYCAGRHQRLKKLKSLTPFPPDGKKGVMPAAEAERRDEPK